MKRLQHEMAGEQEIEDGTAFSSAASSDAVEARLVGWREATRALGDVENNGDARAIELIAKGGEEHAALARNELGGERLELERKPVYLKLLSVQQPRV